MFKLFLRFLGIGLVMIGGFYGMDFALKIMSSPSDLGVILGFTLFAAVLFGVVSLLSLLIKPRRMKVAKDNVVSIAAGERPNSN